MVAGGIPTEFQVCLHAVRDSSYHGQLTRLTVKFSWGLLGSRIGVGYIHFLVVICFRNMREKGSKDWRASSGGFGLGGIRSSLNLASG